VFLLPLCFGIVKLLLNRSVWPMSYAHISKVEITNFRWFRKATVARNSVREKFYEIYRSRKSPILPANWKLCSRARCPQRSHHFAICHSYSTSRRPIFRWLLSREN
jgi:hypothetical protein